MRNQGNEWQRVYTSGSNTFQPVFHLNNFAHGLPPNEMHSTYGNQENFPNKRGGFHIIGSSAGIQENEVNWTLDIADKEASDSNNGINSQRGIRIGRGGSGSYSGVPHSHRAVGLTCVAEESYMNATAMGFWTGGASLPDFAEKMRLSSTGTLVIGGGLTAAGTEKFRVTGNARVDGNFEATGDISCNELNVAGAIASSETNTLSQTSTSDNHVLLKIISKASPNNSTKSHGIAFNQDASFSFNGTGFVGYRNTTDAYYPYFDVGNSSDTGRMIVRARGSSALEPPRGTTNTAPVTGSSGSNLACDSGSIRYNTSHNTLDVYTGSKWIPVNTPPVGSTYIQWHQSSDPHDLYHDTS
tara:strand:- start:34 stop:1101 length:1068 start_codon:yes stop_codon:yes gene_type:complete